MFPHRTPMCAYNRSIDRTRFCFCFFLNRIITINNNNYDDNVHCNHSNTNAETQPNDDTDNWGISLWICLLNGCYASDNVCVFTWLCVCMQVCIHMNVSCIVCMCVCVSKNKLDKTKPKQKTQNGIIMADILKNEHKLYRDWYYSDNKATFFTLSSLMFGLFFFISKRFLLLLLQMATERRREGWRKRWSRDGEEAFGVQRHLSCPFSTRATAHAASVFLK